MKAMKACAWLLLAVSLSHFLMGIISGEYNYPSMKAFWLTVVPVVCLLLSIALFVILAAVKRARRKL